MLKDRNFIMFLITTGLEIFRTIWSERQREREEARKEAEKPLKLDEPVEDEAKPE